MVRIFLASVSNYITLRIYSPNYDDIVILYIFWGFIDCYSTHKI